jgi:hypothetical protein
LITAKSWVPRPPPASSARRVIERIVGGKRGKKMGPVELRGVFQVVVDQEGGLGRFRNLRHERPEGGDRVPHVPAPVFLLS